MSDKIFIGIITVLIVGALGFIIVSNKDESGTERPGVAHEDKGKQHVQGIENIPNTGGEPPTSGDHAVRPLPWQAYEQEIPDGSVIHNMEHGGVYISYHPDLPADQVSKIKALFFQPFSKENFTPNKAIMAPRPANESPIIMSSWTRSMKLDTFDEEKMVEYYLRNIGKSPEPGAS
ncbi:DUF3105 domain-containing protein [Candidatus Parcubacteria bacterium]|nr:DUF3105 domain-containing protein [Candidatus Parcubacteria bacterium]